MTIIKTLRLLQLVSYTIVASQFIFYLIILSGALRNVSITNFLEQRRAVDGLMQQRWKVVYYSCLALSTVMVAVSARQPGSWVFITSVIAMLCLVVDVVLALKGNEPINRMVNLAALTPKPPKGDFSNWEDLRVQWLRLIEIRGVITVSGLGALLVGLVWG